MNTYLTLSIAILISPIFAGLLYIVDKYTPFGKLKYFYKQAVFGVLFGLITILVRQFVVPIDGVEVNCCNSAVMTAGLFFGAPAGIISGILGAIFRWFFVAGSFTRLACSAAILIAGLYSATLRKFMFENKKPGVFLSLAVAVVMEVLHMTLIFITKLSDPTQALTIVEKISVWMIIAGGISVMLSSIVISLISREFSFKKRNKTRISQTIQRWMLLAVIFAFLITTQFIFRFQDGIASEQADNLLSLALSEITADISDASDINLLNITHKVAEEIGNASLTELAEKYNIAEINMINDDYMISDSSESERVGVQFDQTEFKQLFGKSDSYVSEFGAVPNNRSVFRKYAAIKTQNGIIQVGYSAENIQDDIDKQVVGITKNRHVGQTGYIMILDGKLNVISAPESLVQKNLAQASPKVEMPDPDKTFNMTINKVDCRCRYEQAEGYYIFSVLPEDEAVQTRDTVVFINTFMEIIVFAILFALIYILIKRVVVNKLKRVNGSLTKITRGNLDEMVNVRSNEEFASLSDDINTTVETLKKYIAEASARIDEELELAKNIQASALPNIFPAFPKRKDFDIFASMTPAKEVGGDFYDFYITENDTLNFLIADVSGKGIPAAMFMMRARTELKTLTEAGRAIGEVFTNGNNSLCEGNDAGMFVTAWQAGIDLSNGHVRYANAGHNPPLVRHEGGKFEYLRTRAGFVLAGMDGVKYKMQELDLVPGDIIFLYTDGVTEATNGEKILFGEERLYEAINSREFDSMEELCKFVKGEVDTFVGDAPQFDDITMVAFKYIGVPTITFEKATILDINSVTEFVETHLEELDCPMKAATQIDVAIDELFSNIVKYGYPGDPGPVTVKFIPRDDPKSVTIRFEDEGIPYNPLTKDDPDVTLSAEEREIGGLGIFVVKKTMDDIKYKYEDGKNILTIKKYL